MFRTVCVCEINTLASRRALVDFSELDEDRQRRRAAGDTSVVRHLFEGLRPA